MTSNRTGNGITGDGGYVPCLRMQRAAHHWMVPGLRGKGPRAFCSRDEDSIAELIGQASRANQFVDHFRAADSRYDHFWEERWIRDEGYARTVREAVKAALADAQMHDAYLRMLSYDDGIGHPIAASGPRMADEIYDELQGHAGERQLRNPRLGLTHHLVRRALPRHRRAVDPRPVPLSATWISPHRSTSPGARRASRPPQQPRSPFFGESA